MSKQRVIHTSAIVSRSTGALKIALGTLCTVWMLAFSSPGGAQSAPVPPPQPSAAFSLTDELKAATKDSRTLGVITQALALEAQQHFAEAIERYKQILILEPKNLHLLPPAYLSIAGCYGQLKRFEDQVSWAAKAVEAAPGYAHSHLALVNGYLAQGQLDRAAQEFAKVVELAPKAPDGYYMQGLVAQQRGDVKEAEKLYHKALEVAPGFIRAHFNLAALAADRKDFTQAMQELRHVLETDPLAKDAQELLRRIQSEIEGKN
jgi:protein O-GlcNAc transferase